MSIHSPQADTHTQSAETYSAMKLHSNPLGLRNRKVCMLKMEDLTLTHCCGGAPLFSLSMIMKNHAKFLRHGQKCYCWLRRSELAPLILEQKTRHHPSASHAPKKSNFCRASVTPKRSGAVSSIHTSNKHAANRKFQSYDLHSDKHSSCFRWPKNKTLRT